MRSRVHLIERFVAEHKPDILCLQEIKCTQEQFPFKAMRALGFTHIELQGQKAYHGVATLSRIPIERVESRDFNGTGEARHLAVALPANLRGGRRVLLHNFYVPAGGDVPDPEVNPKFGQKLDYLSRMTRWAAGEGLDATAEHILVGDLNVAPLETDVWSHKQLLKVVSHTPVEVAHMEALRAAHAWVDIMRQHVPPEKPLFTWWSYRARDWRQSNRGRRLDHVWASPALGTASRSMQVVDAARDWEKPSDHAPVLTTFDL
ncbi:MAG: exodeoxyribonuclease III [Methyloligellaceae bacterium]